MSETTFEAFEAHLAMLLRDLPPGTTADLSDLLLAYWDGHGVVGLYLRDDGSGRLDEEYDLDEALWCQWHADFVDWLRNPRFTQRPELQEWLKDAPPRDLDVVETVPVYRIR